MTYIIVLCIWSAALKPCAVLIEDSLGEDLVRGSSWLDHTYVYTCEATIHLGYRSELWLSFSVQ